MLTNFFSKSKPIHFLLIATFMMAYYCVENFLLTPDSITFPYFLKKSGLLLVYLFLMVLMNFIVKRNQVNKKNTFAIVLFALFTVSFSNILTSGHILLAGLFVLMALRRAISIKSGIAVNLKIFDASFWICIASLFFPPALFFLAVVFLAVLFFASADYRYWIVPFIAVLAAFVLYTCFHLLVYGTFVNLAGFFLPPDFHFSAYGEWPILLPLSLVLAFSLWVVGNYLVVIEKASTTMKSSYVLLLAVWVVSMAAVVFSPEKNGGELLFLLIPVSVIGAHYFQQKQDAVFKEVLLTSLVLLTLILPFLS